MSTMNPLIQVKNLHKSYVDGVGQKLTVLRGVNLSISQGTTSSIVGASGTGKSTLLHLLGGLEKIEDGEIQIAGRSLHTMTRSEISQFRNQEIGFVFQFHQLLQDFTALENVFLPSRINGMSPQQSRDNAISLLERVGLSDRIHHKPAQLSGGEQQRVAIARAIANSPQLILADEPTGNLDPETGQHILELLLDLHKKQEITLVIITHDLAIASIMQNQYSMKKGQLTHTSSTTPS